MPNKRVPVIGRVRPAPGVMAAATTKPDSGAAAANALASTIKQLKDDMRSVLDVLDEIVTDSPGGPPSPEEAMKLVTDLRLRWGLR